MYNDDRIAYPISYSIRHEDTIKDVVARYPRRGWSGCFAAKIREEVEVKPWCHTTALEEKFPRDVENNALMAPWDDKF
jgi:cyanamide hydratase